MFKGTVIIVTFNAKAIIESCLESLEEDAAALPVKIIVVDNKSDDGTADLVEHKFPWVNVIRNDENSGFGAGNNIGFKHAEGDWVFVLNPDAAVKKNCIKTLAGYLHSNPKTGCVAPAVQDELGRPIVSHFAFTNLTLSIWIAVGLNRLFPINRTDNKWEIRRKPPRTIVKPDRVLGAAMMISMEAYRETGGFDEQFFLYSEEEDLCLRLKQWGYEVVYFPEAVVYHRGAGTTESVRPVAIAAANWSRYLYMKKHLHYLKAEISRWVWIKTLALRYIAAHCRPVNSRDFKLIEGYELSLKSLLRKDYFDTFIRPPRKLNKG